MGVKLSIEQILVLMCCCQHLNFIANMCRAIIKHSSMLISEEECRDSNDSGDEGERGTNSDEGVGHARR